MSSLFQPIPFYISDKDMWGPFTAAHCNAKTTRHYTEKANDPL